MKRKLLSLLTFLLIAVGVGWGITQATNITLTVDPNGTESETSFKTLEAAVTKANAIEGIEAIEIRVKNGTYDIKRIENPKGNYLSVTRSNVSIIGDSKEGVKITSSTIKVNGDWVDQNLITVWGDNVTIQNATIVCKIEVNKVIEVLGQNVTLSDLTFKAPENKKFAGSVYFNTQEGKAEKNIGKVTLKNLELNQGRITFTGAAKGEVALENVNIDYRNVSLSAKNMGDDLQAYSPIGAIAGKAGLTFGVKGLLVTMDATAVGKYNLDAATVANLPNGTKLSLEAGEYALSSKLALDNSMHIVGVAGKTIIKAIDGTWGDYGEDNLISIDGSANPGNVMLENLVVRGSKGSGINAQSAKTLQITNVLVEGCAKAAMVVHSRVNATGLQTKDNKWGGVNVDKGSPTYGPSFTFDATSTFAESTKIWSEITDDENIVKAPAGWSSFVASKFRVWTNKTLIKERVAQFPTNDKSEYSNLTFVYANGKPVVIRESEKKGYVTVAVVGSPTDTLEIAESEKPVIFGGSKYADVAGNTNVTLQSGNVFMIFGGGYLGNVKDANVTIEGGSVTGYLVGGGYGPKVKFEEAKKQTADAANVTIQIKKGANVRYMVSAGMEYAKTTTTQVSINEGTIGYALAGGFAPVDADQKLDNDYEHSSNRVATSTFIMNGGEVTSAVTLGGGFSYSYSKEVKATFTGVTFNGGLYGSGFNGSSDKVSATVNGCAFNKNNADYNTIAALVRGKVGEVSMNFDDKCTFDSNYECYLGADRDYSDGSVPVAGKSAFVFKGTNAPKVRVSPGMQNVSLEGAVANVDKFLQKKESTYVTTFDIPAGKTWSFPSGMIVTKDVTAFTNKGTLLVPAASIMEAIKAKGALQVNEKAEVVVAEMNKAAVKSDLSKETISIACLDAVIASNTAKAKELLKAGKNVLLLSSTKETYSTKPYTQQLASITNLPDSVAYGTAPVTLAFNMEKVTASVASNDVVEIKAGVLTVKKPGEVDITLTVGEDDAASSTQKLKVTKRVLTLTDGIAVNYSSKSGDTAIVYNANNSITLKWKKSKDIKVSGLPWTLESYETLFTTEVPTGSRLHKNASSSVPVQVNADGLLSNDSADFYTLSPVNFVTAQVIKKAATVAAKTASRDFGKENPSFSETTTGPIQGDNLNGTLKFQCKANKESNAGEYDIIPSGLTSDNYAITFTSAKLTVSAVNPSVELLSATVKKTQSGGTVTLTGKANSFGGATKLDEGSFKFKHGGNSIDATLDKTSGLYTGTSSDLGANTYSFTAVASASVGGATKSATSNAIDVTIDAKTPQALTFKNTLSSMVYGDKMQVKVESDQPKAQGNYTYAVADAQGGSTYATIDAQGVLTTKGAGAVVVTVNRVGDETYSAASATMKVTIAPKPVTVQLNSAITKVYDGSTVAAIGELTLAGVADGDKNAVSIKTDGVTASYENKNVGVDKKVSLSELSLTGDKAANYTLVQPSGIAGAIAKKALTLKVNDVTRKWNELAANTKYTFTAEGLVEGENLNSVFTGQLTVKENPNGELEPNLEKVVSTNYTFAAAETKGVLTIANGTPKLVIYKIGGNTKTLLIDAQGYNLTDRDVQTEAKDDSKTYARVTVGNEIFYSQYGLAETSTSKTASVKVETRSADGSWKNGGNVPLVFGEDGTIDVPKMTDYTFVSLVSNVLSVSVDQSKLTYNALATGKAAILAFKNDFTDSQIMTVEVSRKELTYGSTNMKKTYDGNTLISGDVKLSSGDSEFSGSVALDLTGISFNFDKASAGGDKEIIPSQSPILVGTDANNYTLGTSTLKGSVEKRTLTLSADLSAYYKGEVTGRVTDYNAEGLVSGEKEPLMIAPGNGKTWTIGENEVTIALGNPSNYTLDASAANGKITILKPTVVVTTPENASSVKDATDKVKKALAIRETGEAIFADAIGFTPTVTDLGNKVFQVSGGDTENYSVVYTSNQIGFSAEPDVRVESVFLDKNELTLSPGSAYTLVVTVNPSNATNRNNITWSSSDPATVTVSDGKITAVKAGSATITLTLKDGDNTFTATCRVTVSSPVPPVGVETVIGDSRVYGGMSQLVVEPAMPLHVTIVNMVGNVFYNDKMAATTSVSVQAGVYVVTLSDGKEAMTKKVIVR